MVHTFNNNIVAAYTNGTIVKEIYSYGTKVWSNEGPVPISVDIGSVIYSDLTFTLSSEDIDTAKTPIAIVYTIDGTSITGIRAVSLNDANNKSTTQWTNSAHSSISCATNGVRDGKVATATIMSTLSYFTYGAAWSCTVYSTDNTNVGDWYLPSMNEFQYAIANKDAVKTSFKKLGLPSWWSSYIWSSDQHSTTVANARLYKFSSASTTTATKTSKYYVVPCIDLTDYTLTHDE